MNSTESITDLMKKTQFCHRQQNGQQVLEAFLQEAVKGNVAAMFSVAYLYRYSDDIKRNTEEALQWFQRAADNDIVAAWYEMGLIFTSTEDYQQALSCYLKAAEQHNVNAMLEIGHLYLNGEGVKEDQWQAEEWFAKAAELGHEEAQEVLDRMRLYRLLNQQSRLPACELD